MCLFFFFFKRRRGHTIFKCDWSSDVCSSDLIEEDNPPVTLGGHTSPPLYAAFSPDGKLLATGSDKELLLWDAGTLKLVKKIGTPAGWLAFAPDGKSLLTAQHHPSRPLQDDVV